MPRLNIANALLGLRKFTTEKRPGGKEHRAKVTGGDIFEYMGQKMDRSILKNSEVDFVPFHWTHPHMMNLREFERKFMRMSDVNERLQRFEAEGGAISAVYKGKIACCWGAVELWPGVAECWLLTTKAVEERPITITRTALRYFNKLMIDKKLHRLQITVDTANTLAIRWANALRFREEGLMRQYGVDKSDHIIFARTE